MRRILDAATISIALVIFCVFCTLLICVRISFPTAMAVLARRGLPGTRFLEARDRGTHGFNDLIVVCAALVDLLHEVAVGLVHVLEEGRFEGEHPVHLDVFQEALGR